MASSFRVTLSIRKEEGNSLICSKVDGERFSKPRTVKLQTDCKYRFDVSIKPALTIEHVLVMDRPVEVKQSPDNKQESETTVCSAHFNTDNWVPTKKGARENFNLLIKFSGGSQLLVQLQGKWYKPSNMQHCEWGNSVHAIEFECTRDQFTKELKITKETFR